MVRVLLFTLLIWFLYNLVFRFIIPIYKTTRDMKQKFREMQSRMQDQVNQQENFANTSATADPKASSKVTKEDYIDFEEIK